MKFQQFRNDFVVLAIVASSLVPACAVDTGEADDTADTASSLALRCPTTGTPVCGTNHHTYGNACLAGTHPIAYAGACSARCFGTVCRAGQVCDPGIACPTSWPDGERHPCDPVPAHCVTIAQDPCASVRCITGSTCSVQNGHAVCSNPCATVRCASGTTCTVVGNQVSCQPAACPPNTLLCRIGWHYDNTPGVCGCVADATTCASDADCRLVDDYCGGCRCDALLNGQPARSCTNPVACFREPCLALTAHCVAGTCVAQ